MKKIGLLIVLLIGGIAWGQPGKVYESLSEVKDPLQVYELKLTHKRLKGVPEVIREMKNIQVLDLSKNFIDTLPNWIVELQDLRELRVGRNWIHGLPECLGELQRLEILDASRNPLQDLPGSIGLMTSLKELILWQTGIVELPPSIVAIGGTLEVLDLRVCQLTKEDQDVIKALLPEVKIMWDQACNCNH